jgi:hypothetical protein
MGGGQSSVLGGGGAPGGGAPGVAGQPTNIQTSITPQPMFSQDFTQAQGNLAMAMGVPTRSGLTGGQGARGFNSLQSPSIQQGQANQWGQQMAGAQMAGPQIAQQHQFANMQQMLAGQQAREQEAQGWAGQSIQQQANADQLNRMQQQTVLNMLLGQNPWWT